MESLNLNVRVDAINMFIKAVLREQKLPFEIRTNTFDETVYEKLKEAELEMTNHAQRYSKEEVLKSMNDIIG